MALTARQKKGIGYLVGAVILGIAGAVLLIFSLTPTWVPVVLDALVAIAGIMGIVTIARPDVS
jgi:hypothetical protein